jgi:hypothetical protein
VPDLTRDKRPRNIDLVIKYVISEEDAKQRTLRLGLIGRRILGFDVCLQETERIVGESHVQQQIDA